MNIEFEISCFLSIYYTGTPLKYHVKTEPFIDLQDT